ncbi:unnamed protein product [Moneuplotes crassus]|uniref:Uncharacterized protein n=1 Tax=Euplotes crassus TaxID=5936 RepID=A0AAD2D030_EUPCR|nr:unnamed protein product [Moneuplotes crassus]
MRACQLSLFLETPMYCDLLLSCFLLAVLAFFRVEENPATDLFRMRFLSLSRLLRKSNSGVFLFLLPNILERPMLCFCCRSNLREFRLIELLCCEVFLSDMFVYDLSRECWAQVMLGNSREEQTQ